MNDPTTVVDLARDELLPLLDALQRLVEQEGKPDQQAFFARVHEATNHAREPEDLAGPFMELSTSAFLGFEFSGMATVLLDRVLELAQRAAMTLSAGAEEVH